ncbi:hypothetical protein HL666_20555 [Bradyrhizobium sp. 83002]|uniref:hypothetical protein n=1 Tax=Bradyrhizobium aeschynomenes TaxID=2734909 RepID=UPI0015575BA9|nr:hypothetical protein [Bradyrhizobium aeschynomenes]NPU13163.1 hypothetical protein [Bradyrhizobium aeschynomenes]
MLQVVHCNGHGCSIAPKLPTGAGFPTRPVSSEKTLAARKHYEERARHRGGTAKIADIDRATIVTGVDRRKDTPFQAKSFVQTMRALFSWLLETGRLRVDPTAGVKVKKPKTRGFLEWDYADIIKYEQHWSIGTSPKGDA